MFRNYLKTAFRYLRRQKAYSFINVLGLGVGFACSFFILMWVADELRYDRFHEDGDRLYRVMRNAYFTDGSIYTWAAIPKPLAQVLEDEYPEVEHAVLMTWQQESLVARGDRGFREAGYYAGPAFFEIFTYPFVLGDPASALVDPNSIVISEALARRHFGDDWRESGRTLGQTLRIDNRQDFTVTGVFADVPEHSSMRFDFILPVEEFIRRNAWVEHWGNSGMQLYVRLAKGADLAATNERIKEIVNAHHDQANSQIFLQPYGDMRLYSNYKDGRLVGGRIEHVRMFVVVAVFILLIACINFMNLSTARSGQRAREIGVRKAIGATQRSLIGQFLGESVLMALLAFVLALGLVAAGLPAFNALTDKEVTFGSAGGMILLFAGVALVTGLVAGSYPALYLSAFNPIGVLRGSFRQRAGHAGLRKGLVVFQFAMSILLIVGTLTIYRQIDYIRQRNLGLDRENLVYLLLEGGIRQQYDAFRQDLLARPGIAAVTTSNQLPLSVGSSTTDPTWEGKDPDGQMLFHVINANYDYVETMKMRVARGRSFSRAMATDSVNYLINETMARVMGVDDPVGMALTFWGQTGEIVGVIEDFHMTSLYAPIEPTIIRLDPEDNGLLFVRMEAGRTEEGLASLEAAYKQFNPAYPFEYEFLDTTFEETYRSEVVVGQLARVFALLAVFIACLGLFGLASFTAEQRTKEIGIRKALGASVPNLVLLLSRDFIRLVLVAFVLTVPVAYYVMQEWLANFAYHVDIDPWLFVVAGLAAVLIAWVTVSYQSIRAASANPVKALRVE